MARKPWTEAELFQLQEHFARGRTRADAARLMGRTQSAIENAMHRYGVQGMWKHVYHAERVRKIMGTTHIPAVTKWVDGGYLKGTYRRYGKRRRLFITETALLDFIADERTWHLWDVERITDDRIREYARRVRGDVRFVTTFEAAHMMRATPGAVAYWCKQGYLPSRWFGKKRHIDTRDLAVFELPPMGSGSTKREYRERVKRLYAVEVN